MTIKRKPLSKKLRFDVFKRDAFTCQYCGRRPPTVILHVDHVVAVASGGSNEEHNLITSCVDCNGGKGARSLEASPIDVAGRAERLRERQEQVEAYEVLLAEVREKQEASIDAVIAVYEQAFPGWTLFDRTRPSIRQFLEKLPVLVVIDAMELATARKGGSDAFRYFCGICWNRVREANSNA